MGILVGILVVIWLVFGGFLRGYLGDIFGRYLVGIWVYLVGIWWGLGIFVGYFWRAWFVGIFCADNTV